MTSCSCISPKLTSVTFQYVYAVLKSFVMYLIHTMFTVYLNSIDVVCLPFFCHVLHQCNQGGNYKADMFRPRVYLKKEKML